MNAHHSAADKDTRVETWVAAFWKDVALVAIGIILAGVPSFLLIASRPTRQEVIDMDDRTEVRIMDRVNSQLGPMKEQLNAIQEQHRLMIKMQARTLRALGLDEEGEPMKNSVTVRHYTPQNPKVR